MKVGDRVKVPKTSRCGDVGIIVDFRKPHYYITTHVGVLRDGTKIVQYYHPDLVRLE